MNRTLWMVLADRQSIAIVAADKIEHAWRIVSALAEHGDLPQNSQETRIAPCPAEQAAQTLSLAQSLGMADGFLACLGGGVFLTIIGGLSLDPVLLSLADRAA